ncbi:MAG: hypothetical protein ABIQ74_05435, partial [Chitinophagales bacterium]
MHAFRLICHDVYFVSKQKHNITGSDQKHAFNSLLRVGQLGVNSPGQFEVNSPGQLGVKYS